jgi:hypothetical protein
LAPLTLELPGLVEQVRWHLERLQLGPLGCLTLPPVLQLAGLAAQLLLQSGQETPVQEELFLCRRVQLALLVLRVVVFRLVLAVDWPDPVDLSRSKVVSVQ